jgi:hypothetical protein
LCKAAIAQHSRHVQVFDDESIVGLDQPVRNLVQEMAAYVDDVEVVTPQPGSGVVAVARSFLFAGQRFLKPLLPFQATS